jgi:FkbM family methyltransferase
LDRPLRVVDLGAHVGLFALRVLREHGDAHIVSFEPDPFNFAALACTIRANPSLVGRWDAIRACAAGRDGQARFSAGASSSSRLLSKEDRGGMAVSMRDAYPYLRDADLIKVDIEGGEWELLQDTRFAHLRPHLLFLEYHPHLCPESDPRAHAMRILDDCGYRVTEVFRTAGPVGLLRATRTG